MLSKGSGKVIYLLYNLLRLSIDHFLYIYIDLVNPIISTQHYKCAELRQNDPDHISVDTNIALTETAQMALFGVMLDTFSCYYPFWEQYRSESSLRQRLTVCLLKLFLCVLTIILAEFGSRL